MNAPLRIGCWPKLIYRLGLCFAFIVAGAGCGRKAPDLPRFDLDQFDPMTRHAIESQIEKVKADATRPENWVGLGFLLKEAQKDENSQSCFDNAVELDKKNPKWEYLLGWSFLPGNPQKAVEHLQRASRLAKQKDPDDFSADLRLTEAYQSLGWSQKEREILESIPPGPPLGDLANLRLAELDWDQGKDQDFKNRVGKIPDRPIWRKRLTLLKISLAILEKDQVNVGRLKEEVGLLPEDVSWVDPYLQENRPKEEGLKGAFQNARSLEARGNFQEASVTLEKILSFQKDPRAYVGLIRCLLKKGNDEAAEKKLDEAKVLYPENLQIMVLEAELGLQKGIALAQKGSWALAKGAFSNAKQILDRQADPEKWGEDGLKTKCRLSFWLDDRESLERESRRLLVIHPDHSGARSFLTWAKQGETQVQDLQTEIQKAFPQKGAMGDSEFPETTLIIRRISNAPK